MFLGVVAAGCGGSHSAAVANLATTSTATTTSGAAVSGSTSRGAIGDSSAEASGGGASGKTGLAFSVTGTVQEMKTFAVCMRAHGEPTFPDPNAQGVISAGSLNRGSQQFQQALDFCRKDMPNGTPSPAQQAQNVQQAVATSACMRRNGVPNFPDPKSGSGGGMVIRIAPNSGIDPQSPQFQKAQETCRKTGGKG
jgi:hypothetical protein